MLINFYIAIIKQSIECNPLIISAIPYIQKPENFIFDYQVQDLCKKENRKLRVLAREIP